MAVFRFFETNLNQLDIRNFEKGFLIFYKTFSPFNRLPISNDFRDATVKITSNDHLVYLLKIKAYSNVSYSPVNLLRTRVLPTCLSQTVKY